MSRDKHRRWVRTLCALCGASVALGGAASMARPPDAGPEGARLFHSWVTGAGSAARLAGDSAAEAHRPGPARADAAGASTQGPTALRSRSIHRPILFEANRGQTHPDVAAVARVSGANVFFTPTEIVVAAPRSVAATGGDPGPATDVVRFRFVGAGPDVHIETRGRATGQSHYLTGPTPKAWHRNVPTFTRLVYKELYPGIDLCVYGNGGRLEYDFVVSPGANPERIGIDVVGGDGTTIDSRGNHVIRTADGRSLRQLKPVSYQRDGAERIVVPSRFESMGDQRFGFRVAAYDRSRALVIDPVLDFSTYIGGSGFDRGEGIALDGQGNIYIAGRTLSTDFPSENALDGTAGGSFDAFVLKFNPSGSTLIYATYLAGSRLDVANGIAVDTAGNAYITGETSSDDFPRTRVLGTGVSNVFLVKLNPQGTNTVYSVLFGGGNIDKGYGVAVDDAGNAYVTGFTSSSNFPTQSAFQPNSGGAFDAFIAKFNPTGLFVYSTHLGGSDDENLGASSSNGIAIVADDAGNAYVTGDTESADFPTKSAVQSTLGGNQDAFVAKLGPTGALIYSTYLGGNDNGLSFGERGFDIGVDSSGKAYVMGNTRSTDFPTQNALQGTLGGNQDYFVSVLNPQGTALVYSTYLGGSASDASNTGGLAVDQCGNVHVGGTTNSSDFALDDLSETGLFGTRAFLVKIEAGGQKVLFSASIGNASTARVARGPDGAAYLTGHTVSNSFPAVNAYQAERAGDADAYVAKVSHVRQVGNTPGQYRVCGDEPIRLRVARDPGADPGREWLAFRLVQDGVASAIFLVSPQGLEEYVLGTPVGNYTPFPYTGNTIVNRGTLDQLELESGDQLIYAYVYEKGGVIDVSHIVVVTAR